MAKTDKEITSEIVCAVVNAWGVHDMKVDIPSLQELIPAVYSMVSNLKNE